MEYVYLMERTREGEGTSFLFLDNEGARQRAERQAEAQFSEALQSSCDTVPCPSCGRVQEHMILRARKLYCRWMQTGGLYLFFAAAFFFVGGIWAGIANEGARSGPVWTVPLFLLAGVCALIAFALTFARRALVRRLDPNAEDVEVRKERGQARAVSKEQFLKMLQEQKEREEAAKRAEAPSNIEYRLKE
jgi:hypothetical protein